MLIYLFCTIPAC